MRDLRAGILTVALALAIAPSWMARAQPPAGRGTVQGVVITRAPVPRPLRVTFDQKVCGDQVPDQSKMVDPSGRLANAVVTLVGVRASTPARALAVVNERCAFLPRVQVAGTGATMKTSSKDPVLHTTTVQLGDGRQLFNLALPVPGLELSKPLQGTGPLRVGCSTHQWMRGWIYITDDMAVVTGTDGRFTLPDLPPGTYQLRVWHETLEAPDQTVTIAPGKSVSVSIELK